ncbi:MAG: glycosyltransferase [Solirubrobacteraceae bacterium]
MTARVLFACWPFEGHVFPQLSIAAAVRDRGGQAAFYTSDKFRGTVESEGLQLFGFDRVAPTWLRVHERERAVGGRRQSLRVAHQAFRDWLVESIPSQVEDLSAVIARWRPDVIVTDASMWAPSLVLRESMPIPVALASPLIMAVIPGPDAPPPGPGLAPAHRPGGRVLQWMLGRAIDTAALPLRRRLDQLRAGYGLPPMGCGVNEFAGRLPLYLVLSVPELDLNRRDLPPSVHYVGACTWHPPEPPGTSAWLSRLRSDVPWVHVTEGTSHYQDPFLLRATARGLAGAPLEVIVTYGRGRELEQLRLGSPAANVHLAPWVSHEALLPECAALVTTGGAGTVMAGLRAGIPLVIVPTTWDKPDNARRAAEAGAALLLRPRRCTPERLRAAVRRVVTDKSFRSNARRCAALLAAAPGPPGAAQLLETLASADAPARARRDRLRLVQVNGDAL